MRIDVRDLSKTLRDGRRILSNVSLSVYPGELVAVVGGSGAGKTTFLHALNGFSPATSGSVQYNGMDLYSNLSLFRNALGYVPQDDIVHEQLTVGRTLYYAAKLRLPRDTREPEIAERITEVLDAVGLADRRETAVRRLSGGQRKRVSVALELLARPRAVFLDEPTSGLDPALEQRMMTLFRGLAEGGATVLVSTHVTQNLRLCNKVVWLAPGGRLVFFGSPAEALRHFGAGDYHEIYGFLETPDEQERWCRRFSDSPARVANVTERLTSQGAASGNGATPGAPQAKSAPKPSFVRQLLWLSIRYAEVLRRDVVGLALLLLQAPAIALATLLLFSGGIFAASASEGGDAIRALMSLHVMTAAAIFLGASNAAREITKESSIYARERLVNLGVAPYVLSKALVLSSICLVQAAALVSIFSIGVDLPGAGAVLYTKFFVAVFLTQLTGLSMGLLVSAVSANSDRAMAVVPVLLIPQLIFAGALVPLGRMLLLAKILSQVMISKWSLQLTGHLTGLGDLFVAQFPAAFSQPYKDELSGAAWLPWLVLSGFFLAMLGATVAVQKRKDIR
jgi:ABC-type multidrug transport system ATPase subunit